MNAYSGGAPRSRSAILEKLTPIGAVYNSAMNRTLFRVWAPFAQSLELVLYRGTDTEFIEMNQESRGYYAVTVEGVGPGVRYRYRLSGNEILADPASRSQPDGVAGPSEVVDRDFNWTSQKPSTIPYSNWVIYELHVGTFTKSSDFSGVIERLPYLQELGVNAIEIMPVSPFSGERNWGYDGVFPHAVQCTYGGPNGLKSLIDAAHSRGIAVILDVVFNHLGPEGNVLPKYGEYFQEKYKTPWGLALNFDGPGSSEVRNYFLQACVQWLDEYRLDGLRLDAIQTIFDTSAVPFLEEVGLLKTELEERTGRPLVLIAETDANDSRVVAPFEKNGLGMDAHWNDDFHHALHTLLTGEQDGYYVDFHGFSDLVKVYQRGVAYEDTYSAYRRTHHGRSYAHVPYQKLVIAAQNHDQIGNRAFGERLSQLVEHEDLKLAAGLLLASPFTPMLFMGEEYGETRPFLYFISHADPALNEAVQKGRREEFSRFEWRGELPNPSAPETFEQSYLTESAHWSEPQKELHGIHKRLIMISKAVRELGCWRKPLLDVWSDPDKLLLGLFSRASGEAYHALFNCSENFQSVNLPAQLKLVHVVFASWDGTISGSWNPDTGLPPKSFIILRGAH